MPATDPVDDVLRYFDDLGGREWERAAASPRLRVALEVQRRFLIRHIDPGSRVLEIGAGPGRTTLELARLGCRLVVTDLSEVQLEGNRLHVGATHLEAQVERRERCDVRDLGRFADGSFDAVVAFGGPLSYVFGNAPAALAEMLRVCRTGGMVLASVMSLLGSWRFFLADMVAEAEAAGGDAEDRLLRTGDLRALATEPGAHIGQLYRWREVVELVAAAGGTLIDGSASNFASLGHTATVARLEQDPDRWQRFLDHEVAACAEPGALDGGTDILFAARPA